MHRAEKSVRSMRKSNPISFPSPKPPSKNPVEAPGEAPIEAHVETRLEIPRRVLAGFWTGSLGTRAFSGEAAAMKTAALRF